ncbi:MAG: FxDxF family PEP-CTERM protein [Methylophilus sp.]|nr:FxDxF family PEP-CTERM protein [Methylophilus sp.]
MTSSITLGSSAGLTDLQARLYTGSTHITGSAGSLIVPGAAWGTVATTPILPGVIDLTTVVLNPPSALAAGTYTLQIRGKVSGALSGAYSGVLNVTAVPEPSTYGMLLSGMALVGFMARRRKV